MKVTNLAYISWKYGQKMQYFATKYCKHHPVANVTGSKCFYDGSRVSSFTQSLPGTVILISTAHVSTIKFRIYGTK